LSRYYNLIQQDILVTTNLGLSTIALIVSVYAILTIGWKYISFAELVLLIACAQNAVIFLFYYTTFMSKLFETSKDFMGKINLCVLSRMELQNKKRELKKP